MAKKNSAVAPTEKNRLQIFKEMSEPLQEKARHFESLLGRGIKGPILIQYDMGAQLAEIMADDGQYGSNAAIQLANYLPIPGKTEESRLTALYALMKFAGAFDRKYVEENAMRQMKKGGFLQLGHWLALSRIKDKKRQSDTLEAVISHSWTTNDLESELKAAAKAKDKVKGKGKKGKSKGDGIRGRNPKAPTSPVAGLQRLFNMCQKLNRFEVVAETSVFGPLDEVDSAKVNQQLLEKLQQTRTTAAETETKAHGAVVRLDANIERVRGILDKKYEEAEEAYSEENDDAGAGKSRKKAKKEAADKEKGKGKKRAASSGGPASNGNGKAGKKTKGKKKVKAKVAEPEEPVAATEPD